ncbi:hypothetical protein PTTG_04007 [Puccinia triticina 1-1 BBBD Race 1]|uniref:Helicase C-terminal domain-containing protein n=1 Tax=Puccinia triticina (isolate 1-1 / race 1 (BBBD)) TaxID=630390 RepID=A0A180GUE9_PUCT1|nr:hypothetical protein PTTG_04007 [Puccinia triticina 1-1 BBBD Race 1]
MALGLGQNWKRVRSVIHIGQGDPASICQMLGRCGRDGKKGLAIMLVEAHRKNGKNSVSDFTNVEFQNDDDRMDALAITPVCLQVAYLLDNLMGYVPLSFDDPNYKKEAARQVEKFGKCICSNCEPESSKWVISNLKRENIDNFDLFISDSPEDIAELHPISQAKHVLNDRVDWVEESGKKPLHQILETFAQNLVQYFNEFFDAGMNDYGPYSADIYFTIKHARMIAKNIKKLTLDNIDELIGGEMFDGQFPMLF